MRWKARGLPAVYLGVILAVVFPARICAQQSGETKISRLDRGRALLMLRNIHEALKKKYYDPAFRGVDIDAKFHQTEELLDNASTFSEAMADITAFLGVLGDPHTYFVPPRGMQRADYGFRMRIIGERCLVTEVREGSEAAAKLHPGDEIIAVNGRAVNRETFLSVQQHLKTASAATSLEVSVRKNESGASEDAELHGSPLASRAAGIALDSGANGIRSMTDPSASELLQERWMEFGHSVLVWKMPWFGIESADIDAMMSKAKKDSALVLDLRGDPGGPIENLAYLTGWFFNHDVTIATPVGRRTMKAVVARPHRGAFEGKLMVLVDSASASAAELFARVMQIEHRGIVVGDRTAGAVMESRLFFLHFGTAPVIHYEAAITRADLVMSDGKNLEGAGVTPDVLVNPSADDFAAKRDPVLARAVQLAGLNLSAEEAGKFAPLAWAAVH